MPYKNIEDSRAAIKRHYYANKEKYIAKSRARRKVARLYVNEIKATTACLDCGLFYPYYVMDFDHLRDKEQIISKLVLSNNMSALQQEIAKCDVVCSNCHRARTFRRLTDK